MRLKVLPGSLRATPYVLNTETWQFLVNLCILDYLFLKQLLVCESSTRTSHLLKREYKMCHFFLRREFCGT